MKYFEIDFDNEYGVCIKGVRQPTIQEAEEFCKTDMEKSKAEHVIFINETTLEDASNFYAMENEESFPVFGNLYDAVIDLLQYDEQQATKDDIKRVTKIADEKINAIDWGIVENKINKIVSESSK